jgi:hypothetical protein
MKITSERSDELLHQRFLRITELLEKGKAGISKAGKIVELSKNPRASKIFVSTIQASKLLMTVAEIDIKR